MAWGVPLALLIALGAVPLILFLHSIRPRGTKVRTTALFIWERVLKERPLATRLGWLLRKNLLLILQLLAALGLIAALADPSLIDFGDPGGDTVVVVDLTASMKAKGPGGTRFDAARREVLALVDALRGSQRMMLIGAGAETRVIAPFTGDKARLKEAARTLPPTDASGNVKDAILFAHAFLKKGSRDRVVVVSDGAFAGAEAFSRESASFRFIRIPGGAENVGIVGLDLRRRADGSARYEVMAQVRNFGSKPARAPLTLALGQTVLAREDLAIEPGGRRVLVHPYDGDPAGTLTVELAIEDDFPTDNRATLTVSTVAPLKLLYVGPGNAALDNLLRVFPGVQLTALTSWDPDAARREGNRAPSYDVIVFDRVEAPELTEGNVIFIDTAPSNLPLTLQGKIRTPRINAPLAKHPVTAGLTFGDLHIEESLRVTAGGDALVLARAAESPLLVAFERARLKALYIGFDVTASDLPFRVAFPVLFHNAFEWFQPGRREFPAYGVRAGAPLPIFVQPGDRELEITAPSGRTERLEAIGNPVIFGDTLEAGIYTYKSASREGRFAVNLFDEEESNIGARASAAAEALPAAAQDGGGAEAGFSLWPVLLGLVLLVLAVELILAWRMRLALPPLVLRAGALVLLALACVNPKILQGMRALDVILSVDVSRSVGQEGQEKVRELVEAARSTQADTRTGLLTFARAPEWEYPPRRDPTAELSARLDRESTDVEAALQAGLAQIGDGRQGRLLLVSDGNENRGNSARLIPLLRSQGTQVWTLPVSLARGRNEVFLSDLTLPRQVDAAETFQVTARIEALSAAPARVKLLRNGVLTAERELELHAGVNEIAFRDALTERGSHGYELLVEAKDDTLAENNVLQGVVEVKGAPRVLLLSSEPESQRFLARVLRVQGFAVTQSAPEAAALGLAELASHDLVILDNVPAFHLTHAKMEAIETYVRDLGGGLVVVGGSQSYGAGGYFRTPLERILPVDMRPPARLDLPHVALLFVIDKSGSMGIGATDGGTKLDLAKAATAAAADIMNPNDQIGILAFDAKWDWTLPFRPVGNGQWVHEKLGALRSDGGTDLYKAMVEARREMITKQAAIKHVIVLSDGLTDKADFQALTRELAQAGVTVSTVSVGEDSDADLMAEIARVGKGRGYVTLDPRTIPQIFTTETLLISRDLLIEKTFAPRVASPTGPLRGIAQASLPQLRGYVLTYPKQRAELLMTADKDPLLVSWRHGLGRVTAFTSDLSGRWGKDWVAWPGLPQWAGQLARGTMRQVGETRMRTAFQTEGDAVRVVADFVTEDGRYMNHLKLRANVTAPNRTTHPNTLTQSAPGRYEGRFTPAGRGIHFVTLFAEGDEGQAPSTVATIPYVAPYPKEYRELKPNLALLSRLTKETGGEMLDPDNISAGLKRLYTPSPGDAFRGHDTWWPLALTALLLFLIDLVLRSWPTRPRPRASGKSPA